MRVYRIQHGLTGKGMCDVPVARLGLCAQYRRAGYETGFGGTCPMESREMSMKAKDGKGRFGFPSLKALTAWFPSPQGRTVMWRNGGVITVWEVDDPDVITDGKQIVFDPEKATLIETLDIVTLTPRKE